ncbi:MAG: hypothetical protein IT210_19875 [Armatimonadetes bacterium]|nr:hypothetical protein [Armatimonadota bacterium]
MIPSLRAFAFPFFGLIAVSLAALTPPPLAADWRMDRLMISTWGEPADEAGAKAYAEAGFNTVMGKLERLDIFRKYGIRAIVMDGSPEAARKHKDHPAVWGWYVRDEPQAAQFEEVGKPVAAYHEADPNHPAYVNLMAWMDLKQYFALVRPRFLSYDYYQWWWGPQNHFGRLEAHRKAALEVGVPLICWVESNADPRWEWGKPGATTLPDNEPKLRQSVYTALAYGVKGIQWFTAGIAFSPAEPGQAPALTPSGQHIKRLNLEMQAMSPVLIGLRSSAVYHTLPLPKDTRPVPDNLWAQAHSEHLCLGFFENLAGEKSLLAVNRDITRARPARLSFDGSFRRLERFDREKRQWAALPLGKTPEGRRITVLEIASGDGVLLRAL